MPRKANQASAARGSKDVKKSSKSDGLGALQLLPLEIRQKIYKACFMGIYRYSTGGNGDVTKYDAGYGREILSLSSTLYKEARPIERNWDVALHMSTCGREIRGLLETLRQVIVELCFTDRAPIINTESWGCFDTQHLPRLKLISTSIHLPTARALVISNGGSCEDIMKGAADYIIVEHAKLEMTLSQGQKGVPDITKLPDYVKLVVRFPKLGSLEEYRAWMVRRLPWIC